MKKTEKKTEITSLRVLLWDYPIRSTTGKIESISWNGFVNQMYQNKQTIEPIRKEFQANGKSKEYDKLKKKLKSVHLNVSHATGRKKAEIIELSGLIFLDVDFYSIKDNHDPTNCIKQAEAIKEQLKNDSKVYAIWFSVSGGGIGMVVKTEGLTINNFESTWVELAKYFKEKYNLTIDVQTKNVNRASFVSYDSDLFVNDEASLFTAVEPAINLDTRHEGINLGCTIEKTPDKRPLLIPWRGTSEAHKNFNKFLYSINPGIPKPAFSEMQTICPAYFESIIDVHFAEKLAETKIDGIKNCFDSGCHYWFAEKFPYVRVPGRRRKVIVGERNSVLVKMMATLVWLNPHLEKKDFLQWLVLFNNHICVTPLEMDEINRILCLVCEDKRINGTLHPCISFKHNHYTSEAKYSKLVKLAVGGRMKSQLSVIRIADALMECLNRLEKANNKKLGRIAKRSTPTVIKHIGKLNKVAVNQYIEQTIIESRQYEGLIIEMMPDYKLLIYGKDNDQ